MARTAPGQALLAGSAKLPAVRSVPNLRGHASGSLQAEEGLEEGGEEDPLVVAARKLLDSMHLGGGTRLSAWAASLPGAPPPSLSRQLERTYRRGLRTRAPPAPKRALPHRSHLR